MAIEIKKYPDFYDQYLFDEIGEIIEAIEGSIKKWDAIAMGCKNDKNSANCSLCQLFIDDSSDCSKWDTLGEFKSFCPVRLKSDCEGCENTPWDRWHNLITCCSPDPIYRNLVHANKFADPDNFRELCDLAEQEIEYLIELLPYKHKLRGELDEL